MNKLLLVVAASLLLPSMAMANMCRSLFVDPLDREECIRSAERLGNSIRGDWTFTTLQDESGAPFMLAANFAIPDYDVSRDQNRAKKITFSCVADAIAMVKLFPGTPIANSADVKFKFDGQEYKYLSQIDPYEAENRLNDGAIRIINRDIINEMLSSSIFSVSYEGFGETFIEHTYTMSGSEAITSSKNTFRCL